MAEILGIVSSVITIVEVAGKLGTSTIKLKRLWDEVQDVPASIRRCIEELELLAPAIEEMDIEFQRTRDMVQHDSAARRSVEYSRKAIQTLETLVREMEGQIASTRKSKKILAQLKVRLKKDVIEEHQHRLQSALRLVGLSQQTYLIALTRAQPSIIMSELRAIGGTEPADAPRASLAEQNRPPLKSEAEQVLNTGTSQPTQALTNSRPGRGWWPTVKGIPWKPAGLLGVFTYQVEEPTSEEQSGLDLGPTKVHQARLQLPLWMTHTAWDLQAYRAYDGWKFHFNSWNTRPENSDVFRFVKQGRVDPLLEAFKNNQASLYDRMPDGTTLIELAVRYQRFSLSRSLYALGLKTTELGDPWLLAVFLVMWQIMRSNITDVLELARIRDADSGLTLSLGTGSPETDQLSYLFWGIPGIDRALSLPSNASMMLNIPWSWVDPTIPLHVLEMGSPAPSLFGYEKHGRLGLYGFAWQYFHAILNDWQTEINHYRPLARLMLAGTESRDIAVPWVDAYELPLLSSILAEMWQRQFPLGAFERLVSKAASMWLEDLYEAGVDLEGYMLCEMSVSRVESDGASIAMLQPGVRLRDSGPSLVIIEHGEYPEDWVVGWDPCIEELSGEFWSIITAPPALPGAWIDEAEDDNPFTNWCHMQDSPSCVVASHRCQHEERPAAQLQPSRMRGIPRCEMFRSWSK